MNATLYDNDMTSAMKYPADAMYRKYLADMALSPIDAKDTKNSQEDCPRQWPHQQATCSSYASGNTIYTNRRIDDILLPTGLANKIPLVNTCYLGYQSDHILLVSTITTSILNTEVRCPPSEKPNKKSASKVLLRPVSEVAQLA